MDDAVYAGRLSVEGDDRPSGLRIFLRYGPATALAGRVYQLPPPLCAQFDVY